MYLTDLTFVEDGNKDTKDGLINFNKRSQLYNVIAQIQQYQIVAYNFKTEKYLISFLTELPHNNEEELYQISLVREPRNTESKRDLL